MRVDILMAELLVGAEELGRHAKYFEFSTIGRHHDVLEEAVC